MTDELKLLLSEMEKLDGRTNGGHKKPVTSRSVLCELACARLGLNPQYGLRIVSRWDDQNTRQKSLNLGTGSG